MREGSEEEENQSPFPSLQSDYGSYVNNSSAGQTLRRIRSSDVSKLRVQITSGSSPTTSSYTSNRRISTHHSPTSPSYSPTLPFNPPAPSISNEDTNSGHKRVFEDDNEEENSEPRSKRKRRVGEADEDMELDPGDLELLLSGNDELIGVPDKESGTMMRGETGPYGGIEGRDIVDVLLGQWTTLDFAARSVQLEE